MRPAPRVIAAILSSEWAIEMSYLEAIVAVASRQPVLGPITTKAIDKPNELVIRDGNIGIVNIVGPIIRYADFFAELCDGAVSVDRLSKEINALVEDSSIDGILLNIDSPGGQANGISEFADLINAACKKKKIHAYTGGSMCSAAYWLGVATQHVTANDTAFVGSIGVVVTVNKSDDDELVFTNTESPKKRVDPATDEGRAYIIHRIDSMAEVFYNKVSTYRDVPLEKVKTEFGQGGVVIAGAAVAVGMIDAVGSFDTALQTLKESAMGTPQTVEELHASNPELVSQIQKDAQAKAEAALKEQLEELQNKNAELAGQLSNAYGQAETLSKQILSNKLTGLVGADLSAKLMGFDGKLSADELSDIAGIINAKDQQIAKLTEEFGAPKGDASASAGKSGDEEAVEAKAIAKIMEEQGCTETQAMVIHEENKLKGE